MKGNIIGRIMGGAQASNMGATGERYNSIYQILLQLYLNPGTVTPIQQPTEETSCSQKTKINSTHSLPSMTHALLVVISMMIYLLLN